MSNIEFDFVLDFVKEFTFLNSFVYFCGGLIVGACSYCLLDLFLTKLFKYKARKCEIKNGTAGKRKEEKDG